MVPTSIFNIFEFPIQRRVLIFSVLSLAVCGAAWPGRPGVRSHRSEGGGGRGGSRAEAGVECSAAGAGLLAERCRGALQYTETIPPSPLPADESILYSYSMDGSPPLSRADPEWLKARAM